MQRKQQENNQLFLSYNDLGKCLFSYMIDFSLMLLPMMVWNIVMLAVFGSLFPMAGLDIVNMMTILLLIISAVVMNNIFIIKNKGQTLGMSLYGLKIYHYNGKRAKIQAMLLREIWFWVPFVISVIFAQGLILLGFLLADIICLLIDKKHRTPVDFITKTCIGKVVEGNAVASGKKPIATKEVIDYCDIDMHVHSYFSDENNLAVEDIFKVAKNRGIKTISITDINCIKACNIAQEMAQLYGIRYIPGVEIETQLYGKPFSILGYGIDAQSSLYTTLENESIMNEQLASKRRVALFEKCLGKLIPIDELLEDNRYQKVSGKMIAAYVLTHSIYRDCALLKAFDDLTIDDAIKAINDEFFMPGKPCYVEKNRISFEDALSLIEYSGGISVLADPYRLKMNEPMIFQSVIKSGIKGIEAFRGDYTNKEMVEMVKVAKENRFYLICGSDYGVSKYEIGECNTPKSAKELVKVILEEWN